jgi:hypothetical protein
LEKLVRGNRSVEESLFAGVKNSLLFLSLGKLSSVLLSSFRIQVLANEAGKEKFIYLNMKSKLKYSISLGKGRIVEFLKRGSE